MSSPLFTVSVDADLLRDAAEDPGRLENFGPGDRPRTCCLRSNSAAFWSAFAREDSSEICSTARAISASAYKFTAGKFSAAPAVEALSISDSETVKFSISA